MLPLSGDNTLESIINTATNPENVGPLKNAVEQFAQKLNETPDGSRLGVKLIATKIQSQNEWEAMQALNVLEYCMKTCTKAGFIQEVAKFRFLNELIKVLSPKYLGNSTPTTVKTRLLEMIHSWTILYSNETKIKEAYNMLEKQGVNLNDYVACGGAAGGNACTIVPPRQTEKSSIFEDDDKARLLRKLLQSKHAEDIQAANRLIKNMVKEDEKRIEKQTKLCSVIEQVDNNAQLLTEMLMHFDKNKTSNAEIELMAELHSSCKKLQPTLAQMAQDCEDNNLQNILQASEDLDKVFALYDNIIHNKSESDSLLDISTGPPDIGILDDLSQINLNTTPCSADLQILDTNQERSIKSNTEQLHELVNSVNYNQPSIANLLSQVNPTTTTAATSSISTAPLNTLFTQADTNLPTPLLPARSNVTPTITTVNSNNNNQKSTNKKSQDNDPLKSIDFTFFVKEKKEENKVIIESQDSILLDSDTPDDIPPLISSTNNIPESPPNTITSTTNKNIEVSSSDKIEEKDIKLEINCDTEPDLKSLLSDINVSLENIKPANEKQPEIIIQQSDGITVIMSPAKGSPRPGVYIIVVSIQSRITKPITNLTFQAVISNKLCRLKPHLPLNNELSAFNPFLPPPTTTQLLLIANPKKITASIKCMISYCVDGDLITEMGELENLAFDF